jgi:hypothetical protein
LAIQNALVEAEPTQSSLQIDRLASHMVSMHLEPDNATMQQRLFEETPRLKEEVVANWPTEPAKLYELARALTLRDPLGAER